MQAKLQPVEVEAARCRNDDLAIEHALVRKIGEQRLVQLRKVAVERPQIATLDVDVACPAKYDGAEAVPFRLVEKCAGRGQFLGEPGEHGLDGRLDGKGHLPSVKRATLRLRQRRRRTGRRSGC